MLLWIFSRKRSTGTIDPRRVAIGQGWVGLLAPLGFVHLARVADVDAPECATDHRALPHYRAFEEHVLDAGVLVYDGFSDHRVLELGARRDRNVGADQAAFD